MTSQCIFSLSEDPLRVVQASTSVAGLKKLTCKPPGEVGRPGRNGYSLEETLKWGRERYSEVQVSLRIPFTQYKLI